MVLFTGILLSSGLEDPSGCLNDSDSNWNCLCGVKPKLKNLGLEDL